MWQCIAHPKAVDPTTSMVSCPNRRNTSTSSPARALTATIFTRRAAASFMRRVYPRRLHGTACSVAACWQRMGVWSTQLAQDSRQHANSERTSGQAQLPEMPHLWLVNMDCHACFIAWEYLLPLLAGHAPVRHW
jgi:hypothetical protein